MGKKDREKMILAIINNKGGTGKTTTAVNTAAALAVDGDRVLLVDLDAQASATYCLGYNRNQCTHTTADVCLYNTPAADAVQETQAKNLHLLPGDVKLANFDLMLGDAPRRHHRVAECLAPLKDTYDYVILDCPPSLSLIDANALTCADRFIVPTTAHFLGLAGLVGLLDAVAEFRDRLDDIACFQGIVFTHVDRGGLVWNRHRRKITAEIIDIVGEHYGDKVFDTIIEEDSQLRECSSLGKCIFDHAPKTRAARQYRQFARELRQRLQTEATT